MRHETLPFLNSSVGNAERTHEPDIMPTKPKHYTIEHQLNSHWSHIIKSNLLIIKRTQSSHTQHHCDPYSLVGRRTDVDAEGLGSRLEGVC